MKAFMIAGTNSGIGKTTLAIGLMSIFRNVSPFKVGPDYIDPSFHEFVTGNKSYNLDLFMMGENGVKYSFFKHHKNISIVEGVMGLYDGSDNSLDNHSSAHVARVLGIPVILVVDGIGKSTSIAAQVLGYKMLDPRVHIAGVIINKVSSKKTYEILKEAIEKYTAVKCLGFLPKAEELNISSQHLGLIQANEIKNLKEKINRLQELIRENIDLKSLEEIANSETKVINLNPDDITYPANLEFLKDRYSEKVMAIARDEAFSFYYNDNLELLEYMGFKIRYFSPLRDKNIPKCDVIYFGGGYPENFAKELSENKEMIDSVKENYNHGKKIYAECGGFMYLTKSIELLNSESYEMVSLVPCSIEMKNRLDISRFGYITLLNKENVEVGKGHEFHYSKIKKVFEDERIFKATKKDGREWDCIFKLNNLYAGYPHLHFFRCVNLLLDILD